MDRKRKILNIEIITPMLSHGINKKNAEFRVTELKAAMRYWWRAINDINFTQFSELKWKEANWFGGDVSNNASISSPIILIKRKQSIKKFSYKVKVGCNRNMDSLFLDSKIDIEMRIQCWSTLKLEYYSNLVEIISVIGALGQRSRKGYGNFGIVENGKIKTFSDSEEVINFLHKKIQILLECTKDSRSKFEKGKCTIENTTIDNHKFEYPILKKVWAGKERTLEEFYGKILKIVNKNKNLQDEIFYKLKRESKRYATPIYITCVKSDKKDKVIPVISELSVPKEIQANKQYKEYVDCFYDEFK